MKLIVCSDSHGSLDHLLASGEGCPAEEVVFCGDGWQDAEDAACLADVPILRVAGNGDWGCPGPDELLVEREGLQILITHGHGYGVKSGLGPLLRRAKELKADVVLFGHTHRPFLLRVGGILFCNPGSCWTDRQFACLELKNGQVVAANLGRME